MCEACVSFEIFSFYIRISIGMSIIQPDQISIRYRYDPLRPYRYRYGCICGTLLFETVFDIIIKYARNHDIKACIIY